MTFDALVVIREERDFLDLLLNKVNHLITEVSINTPLIEMAGNIAARRQQLTDYLNM